MKVPIDLYSGGLRKRGDILKANVGDRRERMFLALKIRRPKSIRAGRVTPYSSGVDGISSPICVCAP